MQKFWSELSDLTIFLLIVGVPLGTAAILVPLGRALSERLSGSRRLSADLLELRLRIERLERTGANAAAEAGTLAGQLRSLSARVDAAGFSRALASPPQRAGRTPTPA